MRDRIALLVLLALGGCAETDPFLRPAQWQPEGTNSRNLAAMVTTPRDLIRGRGATGSPGIEGGPAVARYWSGKAVPLPTSSSQGAAAGQGRTATAGEGATN